MKMELIQPFINATDAVLAETLGCKIRIDDVNMDEGTYRRKGIAALIAVTGDIEGRVIFDLETKAAMSVASKLAGAELPESDDLVREATCELANLVIGNAVTTLNDQGYRFKVHPPELHTDEHGFKGTEDTEALVMSFGIPSGSVFMNIAMRCNRRRHGEKE